MFTLYVILYLNCYYLQTTSVSSIYMHTKPANIKFQFRFIKGDFLRVPQVEKRCNRRSDLNGFVISTVWRVSTVPTSACLVSRSRSRDDCCYVFTRFIRFIPYKSVRQPFARIGALTLKRTNERPTRDLRYIIIIAFDYYIILYKPCEKSKNDFFFPPSFRKNHDGEPVDWRRVEIFSIFPFRFTAAD